MRMIGGVTVPGPGSGQVGTVTASAWPGRRPIHRHQSSLRRPVDLGEARIHSPWTTAKQDLLLLGYIRQLASVRSGHALYLPVNHIC